MVQTSEARFVSRLFGITLLLIAAGAVLTLAAQPPSFWSHPQTAIRFDGLPIHSATNPMFDFFLGRGWIVYLAGVSLYAAVVWLVVTVLPKKLAMAAELTVILGLCYCGSNWIVVRWNTGTGGALLYASAVAILLAVAVLPSGDDRDRAALKRLCWVMALTTAIDAIFTLIGQPASYWQNPATVYEGNPASKFFLEEGWWAYAVYNVVEIAVPWFLALRIAPMAGWALAFGVALGGLFGGSNWLFYVWRLGLQAPIVYAALLSIAVVWLVLNRRRGATVDELSADSSQGITLRNANDVSSNGSSCRC
jgi:hypothetical protein